MISQSLFMYAQVGRMTVAGVLGFQSSKKLLDL